MAKLLIFCVTLIAVLFITGIYPTAAVVLTAIGITFLFLVFGKEY
ncbi:MAG: hypothetical protein ACOC1O_00375 [bacterium]